MYSVEKKIVAEIINDNDVESNKDLVKLAVDNAKLAFQAFAYERDLKVSLTNEFIDKMNQNKEQETRGNTQTDKNDPTVIYRALRDSEVKRRTDFLTKAMLLGIIIIYYNGDHNNMKKTVTLLTWFEEWFLYFKVIWGRTVTSWMDIEKTYMMNKSCYREVLTPK